MLRFGRPCEGENHGEGYDPPSHRLVQEGGGGVPPDDTPVIITFEGTISGDQPGVRVEGTVTGTKKG